MASNDLYRLIYISRAVELLSDQQLCTLLEQARRNNQSRSITGLLLYKDLSFIQVLEGPKSPIESTFSSIGKDPRHYRIKTLIELEPITERSFPDWSMGFQRLDSVNEVQIDGHSSYLEEQHPLLHHNSTEDSQSINKLFDYFRSHS